MRSNEMNKMLGPRRFGPKMAAGVVREKDRFNFHALRRYYTTMHRAETGQLPDLHADPRVTARVYDATREVGRKAI